MNTIKFSPLELTKRYNSTTQGLYFPIKFHTEAKFPLLNMLYEAVEMTGDTKESRFKKFKTVHLVRKTIEETYARSTDNLLAKNLVNRLAIYRRCIRKSLKYDTKDIESLLHDLADLEDGVVNPPKCMGMPIRRIGFNTPDAMETIKKTFTEIFEFD